MGLGQTPQLQCYHRLLKRAVLCLELADGENLPEKRLGIWG
jgi:hypothetical protein